MSGIVIPSDRTTKQPVRGYCYNPECKPRDHDRFEFTVEDDYFCCPKCKAFKGPMVGSLVLIHLITRDNRGPLEGEGGLRYKIACDSERAYTATFTNLESATTVQDIANCPGCLKVAAEQKLGQSGYLLGAK